MKKILRLAAVVLCVMASNVVLAQEDASEWWFVRLQAGLSTINCGSNPGEVQVTFTNIDGTLATLDKPVNQYNPNTQSAAYESWGQGFEQGKADAISGENNRVNGESASNSAAFYDGYDQSRPWHEQYYVPFGNQELNVTIPSTWGTTASQNGYATIHVDGIDGVMGLSSYAYFWLKAREKAGWYFTGWSYVNGGTDLGGNVDENDSLLVKVFPGDQQGLDHITTKKIYATFQPVLVADYRVGGMINVSESNQTTVVFDASGERVSDEDFTVSVSGAHFSAAISGCTGNKVTVTVTFTNSGLAENVYRGDVTLASKSGCSELTAPVYARVSSGSATQASLYDGKTLKESGDVATLVGKIGTCTNPIISLNANYGTALATDSKWTLDLNGYNLNNTLTVNGSELTVAYSKYGGRIAGKVTVNAGKLVLNGGQIDADGAAVEVKAGASLEQNGAAITGSNYAILNSGTTVITEGAMSGNGVAGVKNTGGTLTVKGGAVEGAYAVWNAGGTASIEKGTLSGTGYGIYSDGEATTTTEKLAVVYGSTNAVYVAGGATTLNNGKFDSESEAPLHKESGTLTLVSGYFKVREIGIDLPITKEILNVSAGPEYQAGYRYFVGDSELAQLSNLGVCRIGSTAYATLEDALAYANNNPSEEVVIFMLNDYVLPAGYYTIPEKATLVVPMSDEQETPYVSINRVSKNGTTENQRRVPTEFRRLTFANGVNLNVHGTLELSGSQRASSEQHASAPDGPYGLLVMNEGSHMTLQSGSELRAWGYVIGKGETDARRGSIVREQFEMGDWKGGSESYALLSSNIFPITQYYIQNIESPVKYHPGAVLSTTTSVSVTYGGMGITASANDIKIVGVSGQDAAMFLMDIAADADNTWVRKWYDAERDVQTYEINSGAHIGSMVLNMGKVMGLDLTMNSGQFVLPITNNMKIHLLSGTMDFTQNTSLLPGAEVEVDKESTVKITKNSDASVESGALYVYDADEWDTYAFNGKYTKVVYYSASLNKQPTARKENVKPEDAKINVHGTFDTKDGYVYTSASGANIFSTNEDAGTFVFNLNAPSESESIEVYQVKGVNNHVSTTFTPAKLKNGVGASEPYANTASAPASTTFCYMDNHWQTMMYAQCFTAEVSGFTGEGFPIIEAVYAKPQEYVQIIADVNFATMEVTGNDDHTFSDANGDGRLFILLPDECQWWEVENVDNYYHCIHPNNDTYYYWDDGKTTFEDPAWKEKKFTIKWKNYDGTIIQTANSMGNLVDDYEVPYGTMAEFLGTNPTRPEDIDYTYDFAGWNPAPGRVTSDVTYTATYTKKERKYTIIFQNEGGVEIERQFLKHNDVPVCENMPTRVGYTLQWSPAIAAVTGDATYTATWLEEPPTEYKVTFYDYNGTSILQQSDVAVGAMPNYTGATPTGKATWAEVQGNKEFTYVFDHWSPDIEIVSATSIKSYTAVYREVAKTYTIIFKNENGSVIESHQYAYGETPVCSATPTKENTAQYTYSFAWVPQIQTVMGDATYQAQFTSTTNMYTVTLRCNIPGACSFTGAGTYGYGTSVGIKATPIKGYEFVKWQERAGSADLGSQTIINNVTLTAVVKKEEEPIPDNLTLDIDDVRTISSPTEYWDLLITSDGAEYSSQIINANNITTLYGNADFVLQKSFSANRWYCIAVPWRVEANGGIYLGNSNNPATLGTDFEIYFYDGAVRAAQGKVSACWVHMKDLTPSKKILEPGRAYMIWLKKGAVNKITFRKKVQASLLTTSTSVAQHPSADATDAGWNAIANPSLFHAYVNAGSTDAKAQYYIPESDSYDWFVLSSQKLVVGEPIYVQVPADKSIVVANNAAYAPVRRAKADAATTSFEISIAANGATKYTDHISVQLNEGKEENVYVIGQDLVKFGLSSKVAQMWINRYDSKLCVNTIAPENEVAEFPISIFAPKTGEYTIANEQSSLDSDYAIYLTYDDEAIWNLCDGAFVAALQKGTNNHYGIRINKAPQSPTGIDEAIVDSKNASATKVIINNQVFIIRDGKVYTITGAKVK